MPSHGPWATGHVHRHYSETLTIWSLESGIGIWTSAFGNILIILLQPLLGSPLLVSYSWMIWICCHPATLPLCYLVSDSLWLASSSPLLSSNRPTCDLLQRDHGWRKLLFSSMKILIAAEENTGFPLGIFDSSFFILHNRQVMVRSVSEIRRPLKAKCQRAVE